MAETEDELYEKQLRLYERLYRPVQEGTYSMRWREEDAGYIHPTISIATVRPVPWLEDPAWVEEPRNS